jgi:hypothetical protein
MLTVEALIVVHMIFFICYFRFTCNVADNLSKNICMLCKSG